MSRNTSRSGYIYFKEEDDEEEEEDDDEDDADYRPESWRKTKQEAKSRVKKARKPTKKSPKTMSIQTDLFLSMKEENERLRQLLSEKEEEKKNTIFFEKPELPTTKMETLPSIIEDYDDDEDDDDDDDDEEMTPEVEEYLPF